MQVYKTTANFRNSSYQSRSSVDDVSGGDQSQELENRLITQDEIREALADPDAEEKLLSLRKRNKILTERARNTNNCMSMCCSRRVRTQSEIFEEHLLFHGHQQN